MRYPNSPRVRPVKKHRLKLLPRIQEADEEQETAGRVPARQVRQRQRVAPESSGLNFLPPIPTGISKFKRGANRAMLQTRRSPPPAESSDEEMQVKEPELPMHQGTIAAKPSKIILAKSNDFSSPLPSRPEIP